MGVILQLVVIISLIHPLILTNGQIVLIMVLYKMLMEIHIKPDPRNIMYYSGNSCRNLFATIQSERMRNFILNTPALQNAIHREVSGPSQICTQGTYTIDVAGATVVWSATPSGVVSLQPSGSSVTCL